MRKYTPLMCKDCPAEIFVDVNMVMIKDSLWAKICDKKEDAYCDRCMEKRLGRKIIIADFKNSTMGMDIIPCNGFWLMEQEEIKKRIIKETISHASNVKGIYKKFVATDTELFLFEIAQQANSSDVSRRCSEETVGKKILSLALELFPYVKLGDKFNPGK